MAQKVLTAEGTMSLENTANQLPSDAASYPRRKESSTIFFLLFFKLPTNAQLFHKLLHSHMFQHCCVILRGLVVSSLPSYTVHLNRQGRQFSRLLAAEVCASAVVMLNTPCSEVVWRVLATHSIRQFPLHFTSRASPCAITFQLESNKGKGKVNRYRPGVAQRVGWGITLLFHDHGTRNGWVVSGMPRLHFTPGKDLVPIVQEAGWATGPVWMDGKSRAHRDSIPDHPARSQLLYQLSYLAHYWTPIQFKNSK